MQLRYISLTGADDKTEISLLEQFSDDYPLYECAILMFPERDAMARNPSFKWREKFYSSRVKNRALHLCGSSINKFAEEEPVLMEEIQNFQRVQINLLPKWANPQLVESLVHIVQKHSKIEFITQYNEGNRDYFHFWSEVKNHSYLFDGSLGKGVSPDSWLSPVDDKSYGYAGGMNPDNILDNLNKISRVVKDQRVWIDMESGIRTQDEFDKDKALYILKTTTDWYND